MMRPILALALLAAAPDVRTPQQVYSTRPNRLADVPAGWQTGNPVQLQVLFNLKYPVNSPEADAFLAEYARFEKSLPFGGKVSISRVVAPAAFAYAGRLTFRNWRDYRRYEESAAFRDWYYRVWKPSVTDIDELFTVLDVAATGGRR